MNSDRVERAGTEHTARRHGRGEPDDAAPEHMHSPGRDQKDATAPEKEVHRREVLAVESPEGMPADAEIGRSGLVILLVATIAAVVVAAVIVSIIAGVAIGGLVLIFGLGLACVGNPVVWAAALRADERGHIDHDMDRPEVIKRHVKDQTL